MAFGDKKRAEDQRRIDFFMSHPVTEVIVNTIESLDWFHTCLGYNDNRQRIIRVNQYGVQIKSDNLYGDEALIDTKNVVTKDVGLLHTYKSICIPFYNQGYQQIADTDLLRCFAKAISAKVLELHSDYDSFEPEVKPSADYNVEQTIFINRKSLLGWDI